MHIALSYLMEIENKVIHFQSKLQNKLAVANKMRMDWARRVIIMPSTLCGCLRITMNMNKKKYTNRLDDDTRMQTKTTLNIKTSLHFSFFFSDSPEAISVNRKNHKHFLRGCSVTIWLFFTLLNSSEHVNFVFNSYILRPFPDYNYLQFITDCIFWRLKIHKFKVHLFVQNLFIYFLSIYLVIKILFYFRFYSTFI